MDKYQCIFIHIPKVAGTSILDFLGKNKGGRNHLPWYVYYTANTYKFNQYFKFSFVRNPWDRIYSAYTYLVLGGNKHGDMNIANEIRSYQNFDHFVIEGLGTGRYRNHLLFIPQSEFILGPKGDLVVDFLGYYEQLEEDFYRIRLITGKKLGLPQLNKTEKKNNFKDVYLSQESINIIEQIYRQDVKIFKYSFE